MARRLRLIDNESGVVEVTSRTLHGRFLMRPSEEVNNLILGVLGRAQAMYAVELYGFIFMSNHFHLLMRVESASQMASFVGYLKANIAKELGRLHGWREKFWSERYHSASIADSEQAQQDRFIYILRNGCKEGLVGSPLEWPGVTTAPSLYHGESVLVGYWHDRAAEHRARAAGRNIPGPTVETVRLSPLPFLRGLSPAERTRFAVRCIAEVSRETRARHHRDGTSPVGGLKLQEQHPYHQPASFVPTPAPLFHAASPQEFQRMRVAREIKVAAYRFAAIRQRQGVQDFRFPPGCFPPRPSFVGSRAPPSALTT